MMSGSNEDVKMGQKEVTQWAVANPGNTERSQRIPETATSARCRILLRDAKAMGGQLVIRQQMFYHKDNGGEKKAINMPRWHSSACMCGFLKKNLDLKRFGMRSCNELPPHAHFMAQFICCLWAAANGHAVAVGLGKVCYCTRTGREESRKKPKPKANWKASEWRKIHKWERWTGKLADCKWISCRRYAEKRCRNATYQQPE